MMSFLLLQVCVVNAQGGGTNITVEVKNLANQFMMDVYQTIYDSKDTHAGIELFDENVLSTNSFGFYEINYSDEGTSLKRRRKYSELKLTVLPLTALLFFY